MHSPQMAKRLAAEGSEPAERMTPAELKATVAREYVEVERTVKELNLKLSSSERGASGLPGPVLVLDPGEIHVFRAHVREGPARGAEEDHEASQAAQSLADRSWPFRLAHG